MENNKKLENFNASTYKEFLENNSNRRGGEYCDIILSQMSNNKLLGAIVESFYKEVKALLIENTELKKQLEDIDSDEGKF